jgi:IrrE N-terminal-like domain
LKLIPDPTGRFRQRPYYEASELDIECEKVMSQFLRSVHGTVSFPVTTDDLTKLIERYVDDFDSYANLTEKYGEGVEGVTEFRPGKRPVVRIHESLAVGESRENRLRTTLTHELGHVLLHTWLFEERFGPSLFPSKSLRTDDVQVCKRENLLNAPQVDWMEWQAGHASGAFLMPASRVRKIAREVASHTPPPELAAIVPDSAYGRALILTLCERFHVSRDAAQVRSHRLSLLSEIDLNLSF